MPKGETGKNPERSKTKQGTANLPHGSLCPAFCDYHLYLMAMATQFWCVGSTRLVPWVLLP